MIYVMSDLHGMYDKYIEMLNKINFNKNDKLYILGDVIDRGDKSIFLLRYIMNQPNVEMILGNHCHMMVESILNFNRGYYTCWMKHGGISTLKQFKSLKIVDQHKIIDYINKLPLYKIIDNKYILVHAGLSIEESKDNIIDYMEFENIESLIWDQNLDFINKQIPSDHILNDYTIIFGHTPTVYLNGTKPMEIFKQDKFIGIDCGCCFNGGRLACLRLDDMKEFYV